MRILSRSLDAPLVIFFLLVLIGVPMVLWLSYREGVDCHKRGGEMVQDGFIYTWQVTDYKTGTGVMIPQPMYKCSVK